MASYIQRLRSEVIQPLGENTPVPQLLARGYNLSMHLRTPLIFGFAYLMTVGYYNRRRPIKKNYLAGPIGKTFIFSHNLFLCLYSAYTFSVMAPAVFNSFRSGYQAGGMKGLRHAYCDSDDSLWTNFIIHHGYLFYLSKFYEVIDTAIIIAKGSRVRFLQSYHHFGAMLCMWAGVRFRATPILYFCVFNSFIHTIMYCYYLFSIMKLPFPLVLKQSLTTLQLLQFLFGGSLAASYLFLSVPELNLDTMKRESGKCLETPGANFAVLLNVIYLLPLTGLFLRFYLQSYIRPKSKTA